MPDVVDKIIKVYLCENRHDEERFLDTFDRIGIDPIQEPRLRGPCPRQGQSCTEKEAA
jgi:sulfite reductase (NADPH) hemoprotein beta-component